MNLRTRVTLAVGVVVVGALTVVGAVLYPSVDANLRGQLDSSLIAAADQAPTSVKDLMAKLRYASLPEQGQEQGISVEVGTNYLQVTPAARIGPSSKFIDLTPRDVQVAHGAVGPYFQDATYNSVLYRVYTAPFAGQPGTLVRAARPESDPSPTLRELGWLLVLLTTAAGLAAAAVARLAARRVLSPVGSLIETVEHITATGDLTSPVAARGRDEIGRLGQAFSAMTAALDASVGAQRRLVADASHELRTPLTSLTTNLELLAENPADPQAPALAAEALGQARELKTLINGLVDLARYGEQPSHSEDVRLDLVAERVIERFTRLGASVAVAADLRPVLVHGDPDALERAIANLMDNAVKFSPDGAEVTVTTAENAGFGIIEVSDTGSGIPAADLPFVFDRFHRSPAARSLPGSGLGLAIVRQIAEAHQGSVKAVPQSRGVLLRIRIPAAQSPDPTYPLLKVPTGDLPRPLNSGHGDSQQPTPPK